MASKSVSVDSADFELIRNTIALYAIALDTKDFTLLKHVFLEDVDTVYPMGNLKGRQNVIDAIEKRLQPVTTQHALTTQRILFESDDKAKVITYFTGIHFGKGKWEGKEVTAYGRYDDQLIKVTVEGQSIWRIRERKVSFMKRLGEEGVMEGE